MSDSVMSQLTTKSVTTCYLCGADWQPKRKHKGRLVACGRSQRCTDLHNEVVLASQQGLFYVVTGPKSGPAVTCDHCDHCDQRTFQSRPAVDIRTGDHLRLCVPCASALRPVVTR